ncbi:hypothetical protein TanjilG_31066 [Lupinus angustifolius]|uniref:65-kDa microtubule-associated protein 6 n=1 Tax=Lupinus angustifolius TaxID=3871 RepID=A0A4P1R599_LUPAN|nr:PREDICTED: 65-kDa microtubule-associated protein 6 [Lupinus angustifolius]OIW01884.1 hypothetical protein TanjilG_31066 [Lupinus angustifolius]
MLAIGSSITSIHTSTTCNALLTELEKIWNDIGESEVDKDRMLFELERECLEVYRRKVDEAVNTKARFHQTVAAKEAELATLVAALGEHDIHSPIKTEKRSASLKEKLASVTPLVEDLKKRKDERLKQFADIKVQIEKISGEISGLHPVNNAVSNTTAAEEQDLSLRRLNEYQTHLHTLQKEKSGRLQKVLQCVNEVHSLCGVLGLDFGQTVGDVHPSLHGTQVEQSTNISNSTLESLERTILKLKTERKARIQKLRDVVVELFELWNLMDSSKEERNSFLRITSILGSSESEITERGVLSTAIIEKASEEVERLSKLKASRMKELVSKRRSELEEICRLTHMEPDTSTAAEKATALIDSGLVDPSELLANIEAQIVKAKDDALSRKEITDRIDKWLFACEEENWLEDYSQDDNRYSAGRGAHINLKRAERARITINKIPVMVDNLINKTLVWEDEKKNCFLYDGVRLVSILEDYKLAREQKEEEKRRCRDQKKMQDLLLNQKEAMYGSKPSPKKSNSFRTTNGYRANGNGTASVPPTPRRSSVSGGTSEVHTPHSFSARQNGYHKEMRRLSTAPLNNYVAISKEDTLSYASLCGSDESPPLS